MRFINREFYRFVFWGGVNTVASYLIYALLLRLFPYLVAYTIAFVLGIFISYFLNSIFVFQQKLALRKAAKYPLVYLVQYAMGIASLYVLVQILRIDRLVAPALVVLLTIPVTFLLSGRILRGKQEVNPIERS
jgi:putative flippase GtrA